MADLGEAERILSVPTEQGDVPIDLADLPTDAEGISDIVGLLAADAQPAHYWATLAYEYLRVNNEPVALEFLHRGSHLLRSIHSRAHGTALLDAMLAAIHARKAREAPKQILSDATYQPLQGRNIQPKQHHYTQATQLINASAAADPKCIASHLSRAIDMALKGASADAERIFSGIAARDPKNALALLGKACCMLRKRTYPQALAVYQQVLALVLPYEAKGDFSRPDPRIGIGLCLAGMGRVADARRAWTRSVELYPKNAAPRLLLGLSSFNAAKQSTALPTGLFGANHTITELEARQLASEDGLLNIQAAWKLNNKSAMTAVALADHFTERAQSSAREGNKAKADGHFAQALKLGEHAIQYADARSDLIAATATMARASHLAMHFASRGLVSLDELKLRTLANRHWSRVVDDLARAPLPGTSTGSLSPLQAIASLSLAQLQLNQGEVVAAMHTLDAMRLTGSPSLATTLLEPAMLEASLRTASHPGASKEEAQKDKQKARVLVERALALIDAAQELLSGDGSNKKALASSQHSLLAESPSRATLAGIVRLGQDALANVELAQILQTGTSSGDLPRAARCYTAALGHLAHSSSQASESESTSLKIRLRANLGAVLGVRALESAVGAGFSGADQGDDDVSKQSITHPLVDRALEHLRVALDLIRAAPDTGGSSEELEFEKTTIMYNAARLQESSSHLSALDDARQAYETILQIHPEYIDARIRLAVMIASLPSSVNVQGKATQTANSYFKEALSSDPSNLDARAAYVTFLAGELGSSPHPGQWTIIKDTLAELFLGANDAKAVKIFGGAGPARQVLEAATTDPFIMSSMGWAYYNLGREARDKKERERCMFRAGEFFSQALASDKQCAVAAQGSGVLLCDDGLLNTAKFGAGADAADLEREARRKAVDEGLAVFSKLREIRDDGSIHVCVGHALSRREEWQRAAKAYEVASKQYYNGRNAHVLTYLAFAEYHTGLQIKSYPHLLQSINRLLSARELFQAHKAELIEGNASSNASSNPRVLALEGEIRYNRYNEAVIRQKALQLITEVKKEERTIEELKSAMAGGEISIEIFKDLAPAATKGQLNFISSDILEQRIQYGEALSNRQAPEHLAAQEAWEAETAAKSEAVKALRMEKERVKEEVAKKMAEEEEERLERVREARKRAVEEAREFQYRLPSPEVPIKKKRTAGEGGASKKRGKKRGHSSEVETDDEERRFNEAGSDEDLAVETDDEGQGGENAEDAEAREERRRQRKKAKLEEMKAARARSKKEKSGKKKKSDGESKPKKSKKKSKRALDSDEEEEAEMTEEEEETAPRRRPKKKAVFDDDLIDSEEEM